MQAELIEEQQTCTDTESSCGSNEFKDFANCLCRKLSNEASTCSSGLRLYLSGQCKCALQTTPTCPSGETLDKTSAPCNCINNSGSATSSNPSCPTGYTLTTSNCDCMQDTGTPECGSNEILITNQCECATEPECSSGCTLDTSTCKCA